MTTAASPLGLLMIGGNFTHQEMYARAFAADSRCRLVGVTDEQGLDPWRQEWNRRFAAEMDVPYLDDLEQALARDDVHLVSVAPEPERAARLVIQAARAGKHVYIDKAPGVTPDELSEVPAALADAGVLSQAFSLVRAPVARRARDVLASGKLGRLVALHAELFFAKGPAGTADLSRPRVQPAVNERWTFIDAKPELFCVGWYPLVLCCWLTGARVRSVHAVTGNYFFDAHQAHDVEDHACLLVELDGGLTGSITVGRTGWQSHPSHGIHQLELVGSDVAIALDAYRPRLEVYSGQPPWQQPAVPHPEDPMGFWVSTQEAGGVRPKHDWWPVDPLVQSEASHFLDCIERGVPSDVDAALAAHVIRVILAGYRSASSRRWERVESD